MEYSIQDIIDATVEKEPTKVQAAFDYIVGQKVMDALATRKQELASSLFNGQPDSDQEEIEAEYAEDQDTEPAQEND